VNQIFIKWLAKRILRRWRDEVRRILFEASEERLERVFLEIIFLWRFWEIIVEVLEGDEREVVGVRFVDICFERSTKIIRYAMYLERQSIYIRTRYDGWKGGMMTSSRGLESGQQLFSRVCVCILLFCFSKASTLILRIPKDCDNPLSLQSRS